MASRTGSALAVRKAVNFAYPSDKSFQIERFGVCGNGQFFERGFYELTNAWGFRPLGMPGFDPVPPPLVVHDALEHFPFEDGTPESEYMALGCAIWLRGEGNYFGAQPGDISNNLAPASIKQLFYHHFRKNLTTRIAPEQWLRNPVDNAQSDREIMRFLAVGGDLAQKEAVPTQLPIISNSLAQGLGWMRLGYMMAKHKRYDGLDPVRLSGMFRKVSDVLAVHLGQMDRDYSAAVGAANMATVPIPERGSKSLRDKIRIDYSVENYHAEVSYIHHLDS